MTLLTRENLLDGSYRTGLAMPSHLAWTDDALERSLATLLEARPDGAVWVFAYGSLIWNPLLTFSARQVATLDGWHRSFCLRSIAGRGTREWPGRVLALEPGGQVQGVALRLHDDQVHAELRVLWAREMVAGVYQPRWAHAVLADGQEVAAIAFVADEGHPQYEPDATVATVARIAAKATGAFGSNADYIYALDKALAEQGLSDPYVDAIVRDLRAEDPGVAPSTG